MSSEKFLQTIRDASKEVDEETIRQIEKQIEFRREGDASKMNNNNQLNMIAYDDSK